MLGQRIAQHLGIPLGQVSISRFSDGEIGVQYEENIRGRDVFLIQPTSAPADNLMELLIMIDAAKRASARRITAVIPYFGYARQDRKPGPRTPILRATSRLASGRRGRSRTCRPATAGGAPGISLSAPALLL